MYKRQETSLIQTVGRAARHVNGEAVLFADTVTDSIQSLINITEYRRRVQQEHNEKHSITPQSVKRGAQETLKLYSGGKAVEDSLVADSGEDIDTLAVISELEEEMQEAASKLEFERAALIRDQINKLKKEAGEKPLPAKKKRLRK